MNSDESIAKLQSLSSERAGKVFALAEDLAALETLENAEDLRDARRVLAEIEEARTSSLAQSGQASSPTSIPYEQLRREVGLDR
jgi:hypothetical protein